MSRRSLSVRWRLTLFYTAVVAISGAVLLFLVYGLTQGQDRSQRVSSTLYPGDGPAAVRLLEGTTIEEARDQAAGSTMAQLVHNGWLALLIVTAASIGIGWLVAGRVLRPVHVITARAQTISADSLDERIALGGPRDELRELADTFDALLGRVQQTVSSERRLVATMSHELRTPLANQQAALDVALADPDADAVELRAAASTALDQSRRAARTIDALLMLARAQSGQAGRPPVDVDLRATVTDAVDQVRRPDDGLTWEVDLDEVTVPGEPVLISRAVTNLVHNAAHHNVPDGQVSVALWLTPGEAHVVIQNTGPTVPADAAPDLVLPFRRRADDRTGADEGVGLGLTVVRAVSDHHGGRLTLTPRSGGGLVVELVLPDPAVRRPTSPPPTTAR
ncbi:cell wall metabolism sensor histidine kinase WalK [Cellulomonas sp. URHE0023]|uniref:sensor histidine kinase n=1 Tax=Cellulomonas sp. URHE0023 TaxID=1380354 RepID=UPI000689DA27|nr:ATP-binding protein [Cellulomonas sp. URHE0023]